VTETARRAYSPHDPYRYTRQIDDLTPTEASWVLYRLTLEVEGRDQQVFGPAVGRGPAPGPLAAQCEEALAMGLTELYAQRAAKAGAGASPDVPRGDQVPGPDAGQPPAAPPETGPQQG
jgi:hypothetical protein